MTLRERLEAKKPKPEPRRIPEWMRRREEAMAEARRIHGTHRVADKDLVA